METINCNIVAANPGALENNLSAQRQFAAWLVHFGLEIGTITNPLESDVSKDTTEISVYALHQEKAS